MEKKIEHVCGLQGFGMHIDDICPACRKSFKEFLTKKEDGLIEYITLEKNK